MLFNFFILEINLQYHHCLGQNYLIVIVVDVEVKLAKKQLRYLLS